MERYFDDWTRKRAHDNLVEHGDFVTCEQLRDICELLREKRIPDGRFSDHECIVWELLKEELDIKY